MPTFVTVHFHNPASGKDAKLSAWFSAAHADALRRLRGFKKVDRFELTESQAPICPVQPWRYLSIYDFEFDHPEIHVPALGSFLADGRDAGLIATDGSECIWSYGMYDHSAYAKNYFNANYNKNEELTHVMILPANFVAGTEAAYQKWYDEVHSHEVSHMPGFAYMRRGRLLPQDIQIEPRNFCPGSQLVINGIQTNNFEAALDEFVARAYGKSKTPEHNHGPRHPSASIARTVHAFKRLTTVRAD
jgi:hypothetical protein